uniref:Dual specificity phosphatase 1 n=1 Tax=Serinus canaria TaxID=9135 RepID=A0A8C9NM75_SERCA
MGFTHPCARPRARALPSRPAGDDVTPAGPGAPALARGQGDVTGASGPPRPPSAPRDSGGPVEILPFLYLGSAYHASRKDMLDALGITALINVSANCPNHFEGHYQYKSIPVEDNHKADISSWFNEAIDFIDSVKNEGGRVFVHCQAGISRSATICLAYLMRTNRVKLDEAFEFVKQRRSIISPNFSFMGQLLQFESQNSRFWELFPTLEVQLYKPMKVLPGPGALSLAQS